MWAVITDDRPLGKRNGRSEIARYLIIVFKKWLHIIVKTPVLLAVQWLLFSK
jgi:hypothetical protein